MKLVGIYKINFDIFVLTGIHIGGLAELEIGGIDNPVVKDIYGTPYIPGSSLKGKTRSLLEMKDYCNGGKSCIQNNVQYNNSPQDPCRCGQCKICVLFGSHDPKKSFISRLIFSDAPLKNKDKIANFNEELLTELKIENKINRLSGTAEHPRKTERVPPGAIFAGEVKYLVFDTYNRDTKKLFEIEYEEEEKKEGGGTQKVKKRIPIPSDVKENGEIDCDVIAENLAILLEGLELVENTYLGGNGTRGYGKVMVCNLQITPIKVAGDLCTIDDLKKNDKFRRLYEKFSKSEKERLNQEFTEMSYLVDILGLGGGGS